MQNGSLARRLDVEVRVFNEGVAFRCTIGKSTGFERLQIADEATEFDLRNTASGTVTLPFVTEQKGIGWVAVDEVAVPGFPRMSLTHEEHSHILLTRLAKSGGFPDVAYDGAPPLTVPWRAVLVAPTAEALRRIVSALPSMLN
jgi:hypothetical protein